MCAPTTWMKCQYLCKYYTRVYSFDWKEIVLWVINILFDFEFWWKCLYGSVPELGFKMAVIHQQLFYIVNDFVWEYKSSSLLMICQCFILHLMIKVLFLLNEHSNQLLFLVSESKCSSWLPLASVLSSCTWHPLVTLLTILAIIFTGDHSRGHLLWWPLPVHGRWSSQGVSGTECWGWLYSRVGASSSRRQIAERSESWCFSAWLFVV